jgi:hypothetical protein
VFTDVKVNDWLDEVAASAWASLHYQSPALGGADLGEISGGGYTRVQMSFSGPSSRTIWNSNVLTWSGLPESTVTSMGIFDGQFSSYLIAHISIPTMVLTAGQGFSVPVNDIAISFP